MKYSIELKASENRVWQSNILLLENVILEFLFIQYHVYNRL